MRLRRGQVVAIEFLDHCEGGSTPIEFVVFGRLAAVKPQSLTVAAWTYADKAKERAFPHSETHDFKDANLVHFTIVRSAIKKVTVLKPS